VRGQLTALRRTKVLARSRRARADTAGLLDVEGATLDDLTAQALHGSVGHLGGDHLDEAETTRLAGVGVPHDLALFNLAVFLEKTSDLRLLQARVDASNEEVGAGVGGAILLLVALIILDGCTVVELAGD